MTRLRLEHLAIAAGVAFLLWIFYQLAPMVRGDLIGGPR